MSSIRSKEGAVEMQNTQHRGGLIGAPAVMIDDGARARARKGAGEAGSRDDVLLAGGHP